MSGLEKFQANEAWRTHFKKLLLTERKITPLAAEPIKQTQRFSLDIADDLIVILEEKKIPQPKPNGLTENKKKLQVQAMEGNNYKMMHSENKENVVLNVTESQQTLPTGKITLTDNTPTTTRRYSVVSYCNETLLEEQELPLWQRSTDESFETLEKMCDKTASDPDSTLFKYLHSDNKDKIVEAAKKRSGIDIKEPVKRGYDSEAIALERLLNELRFEDQMQLENESPLKGVEVTQLEDIEPPSRLWENTIVGENMLQTSPVKMVGLLRPSTIIEDVEDSTSDVSSQMSFQSAATKAVSEVSSACYETAHDNTSMSCEANTGAAQPLVELDDDLPSSAVTNEFPYSGLNSLPEILISYASEFSEEKPIKINMEPFDEPIDLIDLEKTFVSSTSSTRTPQSILKKTTPVQDLTTEDNVVIEIPIIEAEKNSSESDDSVIEILSDEEEKEEISVLKLKTPIKYENMEICAHSPSSKCSLSLLSDDIDGDDDKENSTGLDKSDDKSLHFNDTIEEVEYMMKKGMQYLAAANVAVKPSEPEKPKTPTVVKSSPLKNKQNTFLISPKTDDRYRSPSPMLHKHVPFSTTPNMKATIGNVTPRSGEKPIAKPKPINPFTKGIKPFPKLEIFKKPTTTSIPTSANMRHKDMMTKLFPHIVSPIRTYIKNSTNTPLMSTISDVNKNPNSLHSLQELEYEGRLYKPNFVGGYASGGESGVTAILQSATEPRNLPKKAYIASEMKHIVDERTPVTIPGGKQYQKHIETAMLPAVLKHEGKLKMADIVGSSVDATKEATSSHSARRGDSLADLSLMSGDVSLYTIKDAQKL